MVLAQPDIDQLPNLQVLRPREDDLRLVREARDDALALELLPGQLQQGVPEDGMNDLRLLQRDDLHEIRREARQMPDVVVERPVDSLAAREVNLELCHAG